MNSILAEADDIHYTSPVLEEITAKLALNDEDFVKLQLKAARDLNDPDRVVNREIRLKEIFLTRFGHMFSFKQCSILRDPEEWASLKFLSLDRAGLISSFLCHTTAPIHSSLMELPKQYVKDATKAFKCILGYMGDRRVPYPEQVAQELLDIAINSGEGLRDEIYAQLVKQLTDNPSSASISRGWDLMIVSLNR